MRACSRPALSDPSESSYASRLGPGVRAAEQGFRTTQHSLSLLIQPCTGYKSKVSALVPVLKARGDGAAIVYVTVQKHADELAMELADTHKLEARAYHAGMAANKRKDVQEWFLAGNGIVVATIA